MQISVEWILGVGYLLLATAFLALAATAGCLLTPPWRGRSVWDFVLNSAVRLAIGLGLFSNAVVWLGLVGWIESRWVLVAWGALVLAGCWRLWREKQGGRIARHWHAACRDCARRWRLTDGPLRIVGGATALVLAALGAHILVGGLAPDFGHDTMWYHLSVPGQWVLSGRCLAMPLVFPSNYPLALEAVYAGLLTFSNEIFAGALNAFITLFLLTTVLAAAGRYGSRGALVGVAALFVPALARTFAIAPIGLKNDRFASWLLLLAFLKSYEAFIARRRPVERLYLMALGYLCASALAAKVLNLAYLGPFLAMFALHYLLRTRRPKVLARMVLWMLAGAVVAYAPWVARSQQYSGDPFFPYGAKFMQTASDFDVSYAAIGIENRLYEMRGLQDIPHMFAGFKMTIYRALFNADIALGVLVLSMLACLIFARGAWRWQGVVLLWFFWVPLLIRGHTNVVRYFSICYPLAVLAVGLMMHQLASRLSSRTWAVCLLVFLCASGGHYLSVQHRYGNYGTIQWPYHPMVTRSAFETLAAHAEKGSPLVYEKLRSYIEEDAVVLTPHDHYPYYLKRRTVWADEVVHQLDPSPLPWASPHLDTFPAFVAHNGIDYLVLSEKAGASLREKLESGGFREVPIPSDWTLWALE